MKQPMNPIAGASGPGKYAKRTDKMPSAYYGEGAETAAISGAAPKSKTRGTADNVGGRPANPLTPVTPLFAPTERPEEPITAGVDIGPGPGSGILGAPSGQVKISDTLAKMIPYDPTGDTAALYEQLAARGL